MRVEQYNKNLHSVMFSSNNKQKLLSFVPIEIDRFISTGLVKEKSLTSKMQEKFLKIFNHRKIKLAEYINKGRILEEQGDLYKRSKSPVRMNEAYRLAFLQYSQALSKAKSKMEALGVSLKMAQVSEKRHLFDYAETHYYSALKNTKHIENMNMRTTLETAIEDRINYALQMQGKPPIIDKNYFYLLKNDWSNESLAKLKAEGITEVAAPNTHISIK